MPYVIAERDGEYCVYREGDDGQPTGDPMGCHDTREEAEQQRQALYANEPEAAKAGVKAAGEWELDVLGLPFGGPHGGKDVQGEFFDAQTQFHFDKWPLPPVVYYHGFDPDGKPAGKPEYIGQTLRRWVDDAGVWFRVQLDSSKELARRVMDAARRYQARASSGAAPHLVRIGADGHIAEWPLAELSVFDLGDGRQPANQYAVAVPAMRAMWKAAGLDLPIDLAEPEASDEGASKGADVGNNASTLTQDDAGRQQIEPIVEATKGQTDMDEKQIAALAAKAVEDALAARDAKADAERQEQEKVAAAIKGAVDEVQTKAQEQVEAVKAEYEAKLAEMRRLPGGAPAVLSMPGGKYDYLSPAEHSLALAIQSAAYKRGLRGSTPVTEDALKALALKAMSEQAKGSLGSDHALKALAHKAYAAGRPLALKTDEIMHTDLTSYGLEWVEHMYSTDLWEQIRQEQWVLNELWAKAGYKVELPDGFDGVNIKLESTDPTWYKVPEAEDLNATTGRPNATVTYSQFVTAEKELTVAKAGARVVFSGEMSEDSLIRFAPQALQQIRTSGGEQLEHAIIDGDTDETGTTNINDIGGTPAGTEMFLLMNGFRKLALITNSANSRDAGALTEDDFIETAKLMGAAGMNAVVGRVAFISDMNTYWKALQLAVLKTKDVFSRATIENGQISDIWGHPYRPSAFMHYRDSDRLADSAGKVDQDTVSNNAYGAILCVRWDQWAWAWKRRMTIETERWPDADANQIVAMMRCGMAYRDTEAAAISYNVAVS